MIVATVIFLSLVFTAASGEGVVSSSSKRPRGGLMLPLRQRSHPSWRRHLLRSGALPVHGSVREVGYFYTNLLLGTPARDFSVIIDTGSTITYIPCKGCAHCGKHQDEWFDPDASSTAKKLSCNDPLCNCGTPSCMCTNDRCYYSRTYAERSSSEGWMVEDVFGFPDAQPPVRMVFGCENGETGEIYRQMADGIMGMGNNHNAFQSQLVARGVIDDVFSLCFGYPKDGILLLGDVKMPARAKTVYTPLVSNLHLHYYNIKMEGISVNGETLPLDTGMFDHGYGVVLDSGTTFTYLPTEAFRAMSSAIKAFAESHGLQPTPGADPQYNDICWKGAPDDFQNLERHFPPADFVFGGNARLFLPPLRYLFLSRPGEYCLGVFDNGMSGTLIGGVSVRDVVITYDRRNSRVGFTTIPCNEVAADLAAQPSSSPMPGNVTILAPPIPSKPEQQSPPAEVRGNFTKAQQDATRAADVKQVQDWQKQANSMTAFNINHAILIGTIAALGALLMLAEVMLLGRNTLLTQTIAILERIRGGIGRTSSRAQAYEAETTPLTAAEKITRNTDIEKALSPSMEMGKNAKPPSTN
ncbi:hypothetical protein Vafri_15027 [Volvox africanus]|nr:hypothetical protein Vafri_15027 [Volvox africanus]